MLCCLTVLAMLLILHGVAAITQAALASSQAALPCPALAIPSKPILSFGQMHAPLLKLLCHSE